MWGAYADGGTAIGPSYDSTSYSSGDDSSSGDGTHLGGSEEEGRTGDSSSYDKWMGVGTSDFSALPFCDVNGYEDALVGDISDGCVISTHQQIRRLDFAPFRIMVLLICARDLQGHFL